MDQPESERSWRTAASEGRPDRSGWRRKTCSPTSYQLHPHVCFIRKQQQRHFLTFLNTFTDCLEANGKKGVHHSALRFKVGSFAPEMSGSFCRTLYPFSGEQHQQGLSFQAGEIIKVVQALPGGWWEGEKDGARGWFPSSYVQVLEVSTLFSYKGRFLIHL